jgi:predicted dehydrogenase
VRTSRIAAGSRNAWYVEILGTRGGARYSTSSPNRFELLEYQGGAEQSWRTIEAGYETAYPTITGPIFEFGFNDALLQMWAAYVAELLDATRAPETARCLTLDEAVAAHALFDAALVSQRQSATIDVSTS